ncbi:splicing factor 3b subunit 4 [Histoplasma capsulatum G186AR]|uniref:Splicing factor 3b subunit 4 n=2 Tax=Ajellomyces capsulatus TaxID=5037 RepID=C0P161_AJECG|nr:splicing factor 3b subunit 4 [Histoplasma capsulatum G186AR]EEH02576.1 splicing factor 3b subunit 4 [Histoplasma capsulatum G186AR]KAG5296069.1 splicing factor 3b subunit 4 [Histoplasma capsulatum]QSS74050.1 splicing factor 3b subunit 4 [Histoplasma capsulatum G186AR]
MAGVRHWEQDKEATVYIGNLDERITDSLVWELMLQAGRIVNVHLPKDRVTQTHQGYGFVEFISEEDAEYAARIMNQVRLYGKPIRVNKASADKQKTVEVGAELFVGNLDPMVTEQVLYDTFSRFGSLISAPKIARDDANLSKGYGFVSFSNFEASDDAIANMNGQYLMNKEVSVQYAYKKDGKGERHGDQAERMLAAQARKHNVQPQAQPLPPQLVGGGPGVHPHQMPQPPMVDGEGTNAVAAARGINPVAAAGGPPDFGGGRGIPIGNGGGYHHNQQMPPAQHQQQHPHPHPHPPQHPLQHHRPLPHAHHPPPPLSAPPPGLPARPPPSQAGYGGPPPQGFVPPPRFGQQPPPAGFGPTPSAAGPPGATPPPLPLGFQQPGYGRGR